MSTIQHTKHGGKLVQDKRRKHGQRSKAQREDHVHWDVRSGAAARKRAPPKWRHPGDARWPGRSRGGTTPQRTLSRKSACTPPLPAPAVHHSSAPLSHRRSGPQTGRAPVCPSSMSTNFPATTRPHKLLLYPRQTARSRAPVLRCHALQAASWAKSCVSEEPAVCDQDCDAER